MYYCCYTYLHYWKMYIDRSWNLSCVYMCMCVCICIIYSLPFLTMPLLATYSIDSCGFFIFCDIALYVCDGDSRYPDVTPEELQNIDNICIICREEMTTQVKRLPCGHIFHLACLRYLLIIFTYISVL